MPRLLSNNLFYAVTPDLLSRFENTIKYSASLTLDSHQQPQSRHQRADTLARWAAASVLRLHKRRPRCTNHGEIAQTNVCCHIRICT